MASFFVDYGDYLKDGDPSEIFIRKMDKGEIYDICNFGCDETNFPLDNANALCQALNDSIYKESKPFKTVGELIGDIDKTYDHDSEITFVDMPDSPVLQEVTDKHVVIRFPKLSGY